MSVQTIRDGLQDRLDTISGLRAFDLVQGQVTTPAAWVKPVAIVEADVDGHHEYLFAVEVFCSLNSFRAAQDQLDGYISPSGASSIQAAVYADTTLGGAASSVHVELRRDSYGLVELNGAIYLGATFDVAVYA